MSNCRVLAVERQRLESEIPGQNSQSIMEVENAATWKAFCSSEIRPIRSCCLGKSPQPMGAKKLGRDGARRPSHRNLQERSGGLCCQRRSGKVGGGGRRTYHHTNCGSEFSFACLNEHARAGHATVCLLRPQANGSCSDWTIAGRVPLSRSNPHVPSSRKMDVETTVPSPSFWMKQDYTRLKITIFQTTTSFAHLSTPLKITSRLKDVETSWTSFQDAVDASDNTATPECTKPCK